MIRRFLCLQFHQALKRIKSEKFPLINEEKQDPYIYIQKCIQERNLSFHDSFLDGLFSIALMPDWPLKTGCVRP